MSEHLGLYQGSVIDNNDPHRRGRVVCRIPQVLGDSRSDWCEPIYPTVSSPKVNEVVWVNFINGDLSRPVYFSSQAITAEKIVAGSITGEKLDATAIDGMTITGAMIRTAAAGKRWELSSSPSNQLLAFSGHPDETSAARLITDDTTGVGEFDGTSLQLIGASRSGLSRPIIELENSGVDDGGTIHIGARYVSLISTDDEGATANDGGRAALSIFPDGVHFGTGPAIRQVTWGNYEDSTNGDGEITFPHNGSVTPTFVMAMPSTSDGTSYRPLFKSANATNITLRFKKTDTDAWAGGAVNVAGRWFAIA